MATLKEKKENTVQQIFNTMDYGNVLESDAIARDWIKEKKFGFYIDGQMEFPSDRTTFCDETTQTVFLNASEDDIVRAVRAANIAFITWSRLAGFERAKCLYSIVRNIQKHQQLFTVLECLESGKTIRDVKEVDIPNVINCFYHNAGWAQIMDSEMKNKKPIGVAAIVISSNLSLMHLVWMLAPALASGNCVVMQPKRFLSAFLLAEIAERSGLPPGVLNIVTTITDPKDVTGLNDVEKYFLSHPYVRKISKISSVTSGKLTRKLLAGHGKSLTLESGGKSTMIAFDSTDKDSLIEGVVTGAFFHNGQSPSTLLRLLIQENIFDDVVAKLKTRLGRSRVGNPLDKSMDLSAGATASNTSVITRAKAENAKVFQACQNEINQIYFPPALITDLDPGSDILMDEILGPIIIAFPFRTAKEAITITNNNKYGLSASVWTENITLALEVANNLKVGTVWINCQNVFDPSVPFGGCRQSGFGRFCGKEGLLEYLVPKWEFPVGDITTEAPQSSIVPELSKIDVTYKLYVGGDHKRPDSNKSRQILSMNGVEIASVGEGTRKDIRNAVEAAQKIQASWAKKSSYNRAQILFYIAENLEKRRDEFVRQLKLFSEQNAEREFDASIERLFFWASYCDKFFGSVKETGPSYTTIQTNEPIGTIGIICPNSFPLLGFISLIAPAIARGNAVIVIPSEHFPLPALDFCQVLDTSDVPGGVINVVTGDSDLLAESLTSHHDVQSVWYFGSKKGCTKIESVDILKPIWTDNGQRRNWLDNDQGQGEEFLYHSTHCKTIWMPVGDIFAN